MRKLLLIAAVASTIWTLPASAEYQKGDLRTCVVPFLDHLQSIYRRAAYKTRFVFEIGNATSPRFDMSQ